jgi:hypothetical protein
MWGGGANNTPSWEEPTYQYCNDEVVSDGVSYALLSGKAQASWVMSHSVVPIGGGRIVTRSKGNVIYEIDGKPAVEVLKEYLQRVPSLKIVTGCVTPYRLPSVSEPLAT